MPEFTIASPSEQVAGHLRGELMLGRWTGLMPGGPALAAELGVDGKTVWAALGLLEEEGLLEAQGPGRRRKITTVPEHMVVPTLRVGVLDYEPPKQTEEWTVSMLQLLKDEGHSAFFAEKSLLELGMDVDRVARLVAKTRADAWVVCSGSREVLSWFAGQETPVFALFGRRRTLPIAGVGPDHVAAGRVATRCLIALGHRRIVVLRRESQRIGGMGPADQAIFEAMEAAGLPVGAYNLPEWKDTREDFHRVLDGLFQVTPPTALIVDEPFLFHAAKDHLARRGIHTPDHVSMLCTDPDSTFAWMVPSVAHVHWDRQAVVRRVLRWTNNIARGRRDRRQSFTKAEYVDGGTVGLVPG